MSITATVTGARITASVSGDSITATVPAGGVAAAVTGGIGPQGPAGEAGETGGATTLGDLTDVQITAVSDGNVLRYNGSSSKWANYAELDLVDGGNFLWLIASGFAGPLALLLQKLS